MSKSTTDRSPQMHINIAAPKLRTMKFELIGTAPLVQLRFSQKAMNLMMDKMKAGSQSKNKKQHSARDFDDDFVQAQHISEEGWVGIPAGAIRSAMISACRLVGFKMTIAKLSVFVLADGIDKVDGVPLIKIHSTMPPEKNIMAVRNATGVADIRCRPMWKQWELHPKIQFDEDQFSYQDVTNLLMRVGQQVGLGEGRPDSRDSAGLGWGLFKLADK